MTGCSCDRIFKRKGVGLCFAGFCYLRGCLFQDIAVACCFFFHIICIVCLDFIQAVGMRHSRRRKHSKPFDGKAPFTLPVFFFVYAAYCDHAGALIQYYITTITAILFLGRYFNRVRNVCIGNSVLIKLKPYRLWPYSLGIILIVPDFFRRDFSLTDTGVCNKYLSIFRLHLCPIRTFFILCYS